mgnify:CR=1 FL=1
MKILAACDSIAVEREVTLAFSHETVPLAGQRYHDQPEKVKKSVTYPKQGGGPRGCLGPLVGSRGSTLVGVKGQRPQKRGPEVKTPGKVLRFSSYIIMIGNISNHL